MHRQGDGKGGLGYEDGGLDNHDHWKIKGVPDMKGKVFDAVVIRQRKSYSRAGLLNLQGQH